MKIHGKHNKYKKITNVPQTAVKKKTQFAKQLCVMDLHDKKLHDMIEHNL